MKSFATLGKEKRIERVSWIVLCALLLTLQIPTESDLPGHRTYIDPKRLPKAYSNKSKITIPKIIRGKTPTLKAPPGFNVEVFATGLQSPRNLCVAANGDVLVVESYRNRVTLLRDGAKSVFVEKLKLPYGIAIRGDYLYIANTDSVARFPYQVGQKKVGQGETIIDGIPSKGYRQHWTRNLTFSPDGQKLFLTVGSETNKDVEAPPRGCILQFDRDGSDRSIFANGIRNPVGLAFRPGTQELWATGVERDYMGDDLVPEFVAQVDEGDFFGWPWWFIGKNRDIRVPLKNAPKKEVKVPDVLLTAHSVPLGIAFYNAEMFPPAYRGDAFIALRGSTNRRVRSGYKIVRLDFEKGRLTPGFVDFVTGWAPNRKKQEVYGRPVAVAVWTDGSLLIADESAHCIYRVSYSG